MLSRIDIQKRNWLFWIVLLLTAGWVVWVAPEEQTLGPGIKYVYVHVALMWVGMLGLVVAGLLGLGVLLLPKDGLSTLMQTIGWVGLAFYAGGVGMSILASKVNWGNVFWQEPRMRVALNMLALVIIIEIFVDWVPWIRLRGLLSAGLIVTLLWTTLSAPLVLHPRNPIGNSSSSAIQMTFLGLFLLSGLAAAWFIWYFRRTIGTSTA